MLKPSNDVIRAMANLTGNPNWDTFTNWVQDSLFAQSVANNSTVGDAVIRNQGRNLELDELLKHIRKSPTYTENLKSAQRRGE